MKKNSRLPSEAIGNPAISSPCVESHGKSLSFKEIRSKSFQIAGGICCLGWPYCDMLTCDTQTPGKKNWRAKFLLPSGDSFLFLDSHRIFVSTNKQKQEHRHRNKVRHVDVFDVVFVVLRAALTPLFHLHMSHTANSLKTTTQNILKLKKNMEKNPMSIDFSQ